MILILFSLMIALAIVVVYKFETIVKPAKSAPEASIQPEPEPVEPEVAIATSGFADYVPDPLIVRHLDEGKATLLVRHRSLRGKATGQLIIWSGKKRRRFEDSYYDLGATAAVSLGDELIEEFITKAMSKIGELKSAGSNKRRKAESPQAAVEVTGEATVSFEENQKPDPAIRLKRFPSVFRGCITEAAVMPRVVGGDEFECFGLKYRTSEGVEDVVWGVNLKTAMRDANVKVGDEVEIIKIGRKTVDEGKAPMNLYKIAKINVEDVVG